MKSDTETEVIDPELETTEEPTTETTPEVTSGTPVNGVMPATPPIDRCEYVALKGITIDAGTQPRAVIDEEAIEDYANAIKTAKKDGIAAGKTEEEWENPFDKLREEDLPQLFENEKGELVMASGFTRYAAHKKAGVKDMFCAVRKGTKRDAILYSVSTNAAHGQRRKNADIKRAVQMLVNDDEWSQWSDAHIARLAHVSAPTVKTYRPAAKTHTVKKTMRAGKATTVDTTNQKGRGKKKDAAPVVEDNTKKAPAKKSTEDKQKELDRMLGKIATNCGEEGGKFRAGVLDGAIDLTHKDVEDLASFAPKKQKEVLPLVMGGPRMKPAKAFDFIGSTVSEKIQDDLHNRAIAAGGKFVFEAGGFTISCEIAK